MTRAESRASVRKVAVTICRRGMERFPLRDGQPRPGFDVLTFESRAPIGAHGITRGSFRRFPRDRPILALAIAILTVEIVGASASIFTAQGFDTW
jgi:hypothetical protein